MGIKIDNLSSKNNRTLISISLISIPLTLNLRISDIVSPHSFSPFRFILCEFIATLHPKKPRNYSKASKLARIGLERKLAESSRNLPERFGNRDTFDRQIRSGRQILFLSSRSSPFVSFYTGSNDRTRGCHDPVQNSSPRYSRAFFDSRAALLSLATNIGERSRRKTRRIIAPVNPCSKESRGMQTDDNERACLLISKSRHRMQTDEKEKEKEREAENNRLSILPLPLFTLLRGLSQQSGRVPARLQQCLLHLGIRVPVDHGNISQGRFVTSLRPRIRPGLVPFHPPVAAIGLRTRGTRDRKLPPT